MEGSRRRERVKWRTDGWWRESGQGCAPRSGRSMKRRVGELVQWSRCGGCRGREQKWCAGGQRLESGQGRAPQEGGRVKGGAHGYKMRCRCARKLCARQDGMVKPGAAGAGGGAEAAGIEGRISRSGWGAKVQKEAGRATAQAKGAAQGKEAVDKRRRAQNLSGREEAKKEPLGGISGKVCTTTGPPFDFGPPFDERLL